MKKEKRKKFGTIKQTCMSSTPFCGLHKSVCPQTFIPNLCPLRSLFLCPSALLRLACFLSDPVSFFLSLSPSPLSLFLSPLPLSSHLDLIDRANSPSAIKDSLDFVCTCVLVCAKHGRPKYKQPPIKRRFQQTIQAYIH